RSRIEVTPTWASAWAERSPTPFSRVTGIAASSVKVMGPSGMPGRRLLDAEQVGVERLAAVVDLGRHPRPVLGQPLGHRAGVGRGGALALDDRDDLVLVGDQRVEQLAGGVGRRALDRFDAVPGDAQVVALGDRTELAGRVAHRARDLA